MTGIIYSLALISVSEIVKEGMKVGKPPSALGSEHLAPSLVSPTQQLLTLGNVLPVNDPRFFTCKLGINVSTSLSFY